MPGPELPESLVVFLVRPGLGSARQPGDGLEDGPRGGAHHGLHQNIRERHEEFGSQFLDALPKGSRLGFDVKQHLSIGVDQIRLRQPVERAGEVPQVRRTPDLGNHI